ncbi:MAG: hypothetical protein K8R53_03200, partial [Bacteroidales bacterium]|nr:hypothetical protein [Bacteroidales bacterium]
MKKLKYFTILLSILFVSIINSFAGWVITSGSSVQVTIGTVIYTPGNIQIESNGVLNNDGHIALTGNLSNNNSTSLGMGTLEFNGTIIQEITGTETVNTGKLKIS